MITLNKCIWLAVAATFLLGFFWGYYKIFLANAGRFRLNRMVLLSMVLLSIILPFAKFSINAPAPASFTYDLETSLITQVIGEGAISIISQQASWVAYVGFFYLVICLGLLFRLIFRMSRLIGFIRAHKSGRSGKGYTLVPTGGKLPTSSFLHYLFWDETLKLDDKERDQIMEHEICHIRKHHSWDLLILEVLGIFYWFNPFLFLIRRELTKVHEYEADRAALAIGSPSGYTDLLLRHQGAYAPKMSINHTFFKSFTFNRLKMISQAKKNRTPFYLLLLPVFLLAITLISCHAQPVSGVASPDIEKVATEVDNPPEPNNYAEIIQAISYPEEAKAKGIQGMVAVRVLVDKKGNTIDYKIVKKADELLNQAVKAHILDLKFKPALKDGKPVQFWVNIPFTFKLDPKGEK